MKSAYKLKILNDGSSFYRWEHPWRGWVPLTNKDISLHLLWKGKSDEASSKLDHTSYIKEYSKKYKKKTS